MPIKLNTASGGGVILTGANTATDKTITVPAADTTMVGTDSTQTLSNKTFSGAQTFGTASLAEPSGSAPLYMCRAWVNFNGTGTVAIRASGNVSSITDNGTGDYTVNFTSAMTDTNYCVVLPSMMTGGNTSQYFGVSTPSNNSYATKTTSAVRVAVYNTLISNQDVFDANVAVFR
jgi:hypothetical protein